MHVSAVSLPLEKCPLLSLLFFIVSHLPCLFMTVGEDFTAHAHWEQQAEIRPFCAREMACQPPSGNDDNGDKKPPREIKKKTGYECEFVEPPPKQFQSECPICLQILREPRLIDCCGHNYCVACIAGVSETMASHVRCVMNLTSLPWPTRASSERCTNSASTAPIASAAASERVNWESWTSI